MESALLGKQIGRVEFVEDNLVLNKIPSETYQQEVLGATVAEVGRKGKFWWIRLENRMSLCGHLGMAGWIREVGQPTARLKEHGKKPLDDESGRPRILKMRLSAQDGRTVVMTDGRRLARLWLAEDPLQSKPIKQLGPDVYKEPRTPVQLHELLRKRSAPIKALLLDQKLFAGVGNWLADEVLYQSRISPKREGNKISKDEFEVLLARLKKILDDAIDAKADENLFPSTWLFHRRWGGKRGADAIDGMAIVREEVGGRTTAWVPELQK